MRKRPLLVWVHELTFAAKPLLLSLALLMFVAGFVYGQHQRQCYTYEASCGSFQIVQCLTLIGKCPTGQCGNPDQAGCCLWEGGYCNQSGDWTATVVCGNSCNP